MPRSLLIVMCLAFMTSAYGQNAMMMDACQVHGTVRDTNGQPLPGAVIVVEQLGQSLITEADGKYCLTGLPAGTYHLILSCDGFQPLHSNPVAVDGILVIMDFVLTAQFRSQMVVTATRTKQRLEDVVVRTELLDRDRIEIIEARTMADAVEFVTGVRVENNCQNCNFSQVRLLGLDGAYSQILVDSQPTLSAMALVYGVEHIPARMMERVEIVKGGGSALYGPGSVGGVINVIPREPSTNGGDVSSRFEWMDGKPAHSATASLDWVSQDQKTAVTTFGQSDDYSPVDVDGDGFTEAGEKNLQSLGFRLIQYVMEGEGKFTLDYSHMREHRRGGDNLDLPEFLAEVAEAVDSKRNMVGVTWYHSAAARLDYKFNLTFNDTKRDTYYGAGMDPNAYGSTDNPLMVADLQFNYRLPKHTITWGAQYQDEELIDMQPAYGRILDESYDNLGVFLQDDWSITDKAELLLGVRFDDHSAVDGGIFSPRAALRYHISDGLTVRASVASGFRGPQVFDEDLHITQAGAEAQVIRNSPDLQEESSRNTLAGIEWNTELNSGGRFLVEANIFKTDLEDTFLVQETDDPNTGQFEFTRSNYGEATVDGIEVNLGFAPSARFKIEGGFVFQNSEFDEPEEDFGTKNFFRTPDEYGVFSLFWKTPIDVDFSLGAIFTGEMDVPQYEGPGIDEPVLEKSPTFTTLDVRLAKVFASKSEPTTKWKYSLGAKNITNE